MSNHFFNLSDRFGSDLENLNREQKLLLTTTLVAYMWRQEYSGFTSSLEEAWKETLVSFKDIIEGPHAEFFDEEFEECLKILQGVSVEDAGLIARRLLDQCLVGIANKLRHEEYADALIKKGFSKEIAEKAAYLRFITCFRRGYTPEEMKFLEEIEEQEDD